MQRDPIKSLQSRVHAVRALVALAAGFALCATVATAHNTHRVVSHTRTAISQRAHEARARAQRHRGCRRLNSRTAHARERRGCRSVQRGWYGCQCQLLGFCCCCCPPQRRTSRARRPAAAAAGGGAARMRRTVATKKRAETETELSKVSKPSTPPSTEWPTHRGTRVAHEPPGIRQLSSPCLLWVVINQESAPCPSFLPQAPRTLRRFGELKDFSIKRRSAVPSPARWRSTLPRFPGDKASSYLQSRRD
jgi:hypothetical protein